MTTTVSIIFQSLLKSEKNKKCNSTTNFILNLFSANFSSYLPPINSILKRAQNILKASIMLILIYAILFVFYQNKLMIMNWSIFCNFFLKKISAHQLWIDDNPKPSLKWIFSTYLISFSLSLLLQILICCANYNAFFINNENFPFRYFFQLLKIS